VVLRTPKGWTGPAVVDGKQVEGTNLSHQVPLSGLAKDPEHLRMLEEWMLSYRPQDLFDATGALQSEVAALAPRGEKRMSATPYSNGGRLLTPLQVPPTERFALDVERPADAAGRHEQLVSWCLAKKSSVAPRRMVDLILGPRGTDALLACRLGRAASDDVVEVFAAARELPRRLAFVERQRAAGRARAASAAREGGRFTRAPADGSSLTSKG
jgi:predicted component of type VI protein secretion system